MKLITNPISKNNYILTDKIAFGSFGKIYIGRTFVGLDWTDEKYAVKEIEIEKGFEDEDISYIENEIELQKKVYLKCGSVPKIIDSFLIESNYYIVMEFIEGLTFWQHRVKKFKSESEIENYAIQAIKILDCIHSQGIIHRDLKPDNIMITPEHKVIFLDFGLSCLKDKCTYHAMPEGYYPPEFYQLQQDYKWDYKYDVFNLGVTLIQLFEKMDTNKPFNMKCKTKELCDEYYDWWLENNELPKTPLTHIIKKMVHPNNDLRLTSALTLEYVEKDVIESSGEGGESGDKSRFFLSSKGL